MRRLLENGANTSYVNKLNDKNFKVEEFVIDPIEIIKKYNEYGNPYIPKPRDIFLPIRKNSKGINLSLAIDTFVKSKIVVTIINIFFIF